METKEPSMKSHSSKLSKPTSPQRDGNYEVFQQPLFFQSLSKPTSPQGDGNLTTVVLLIVVTLQLSKPTSPQGDGNGRGLALLNPYETKLKLTQPTN